MKLVCLVVALVAGTALSKPSLTENELLKDILTRIEKDGKRAATLIDNGFSSAEQQAIVDSHNKYRQQVQPPARFMQTLVWDNRLAHLAKEWADLCKLPSDPHVHGQPDDKPSVLGADDQFLGQNIYWGVSSGTKAVDAWHAEVYFYDRCAPYQQRCLPGKECGHYTQMVWAETGKVGCGVNMCADANGRQRAMIVCNYLPGGNIDGQNPFELQNIHGCGNCGSHFCGENGYATAYGSSCTCKCRPGYAGARCDQRDCSTPDDAQCGRYGLSPSSPFCDQSKAYAMSNGKRIRDVCLRVCGICKAPTTPAPTLASCVDPKGCDFYDAEDCNGLIGDGRQLREVCPKLCDNCPGNCPQDDAYCKLYRLSPSNVYCNPNIPYQMANGKLIREVCKSICGLCPGKRYLRNLFVEDEKPIAVPEDALLQ